MTHNFPSRHETHPVEASRPVGRAAKMDDTQQRLARTGRDDPLVRIAFSACTALVRLKTTSPTLLSTRPRTICRLSPSPCLSLGEFHRRDGPPSVLCWPWSTCRSSHHQS